MDLDYNEALDARIDRTALLTGLASGPVWSELIKPGVQARINAAMTALLESTDPIKDAAIKGELKTLSWILSWEHRAEQAAKRLEELRRPARPDEPVGSIYG